MIGRTLGHYTILDKLGEGGMGVVYLAEDTTLDRKVALKVLPAELADNQERLDRFEREAKTLAALDHPNIVHIHTVEKADGVRFLTMGLVEGHQLSDLIPDGGMPLKTIFEISIPLAEALAAAHDKGVVHRDLKPGNVMVSEEGRVKVLDFGLAKVHRDIDPASATQLVTEPLTQEGRIVGTVPYMSPEQLEGKPTDGRTDLFSLGVMLYEMATGDRPFRGETSVSLMSSIIKDTPEAPHLRRPELPDHLGRIIQRCLEKDPEDRYQTMRDALLELRSLRREVESSTASAVSARPRRPGPSRSGRPRWIWAAAAIILVVASLAVWSVAGRRGGGPSSADGSDSAARARISDPQARVLYDQARQYANQAESAAQWDLAELTMRRALEREPDNPWLKAELVDVMVDRQRLHPKPGTVEEASGLIAESVAAEPGLVGAWLAKGKLAQLEGDNRTALEAARKVTVIDPADPRGAYLLGRTLIKEGSKEEGMAEIRRGAELDPDPVNAHFNLGYGLQGVGRLDDAVFEYRRVIELAPGHGDALNNLAVIYYWMGRYLDALPLFRRLVQIRPEDLSAASNLGTVYFYLDRMEEAVDAYRIAEQLNRTDTTIKVNLGDAYTKLGDLERADEWYAKAIATADEGLERGGDRVDLEGLRSLCLAKLGRFEEAIAVSERLARDHPSDYYVLYGVAQVYALAGERERLLEYTQRAIDAGYPREEFIRAPEFEPFKSDPAFQGLLSGDPDAG